MVEEKSLALPLLFASHPRTWPKNFYVYPVISRRARGLSIGVNLNPDAACNFDCIYCSIDRRVPPQVRHVDLDRLRAELAGIVRLACTGELFAEGPLAATPASHRVLRDIAFSGDGEPTTCPRFVEAVQIAADVRRDFRLDSVKLVLITDAAYLDRPRVREGLAILDANNGEIWAKLDAGTQAYFERVNRPNVTLEHVLANIIDAARVRPIVIQSLWMRIQGEAPPEAEIDAFADRLAQILAAGGRLSLVQIYTVARPTAESYVTALTDAELHALADRVARRVTVPLAVFGAAG